MSEGQADQHRAVRLVGRRGGGPARLRSTTWPTSPTEQADDIALYLNFDMIASPNYIFGVYDGDNSGGTAPRRASSREGSAADRGRLRAVLRPQRGSRSRTATSPAAPTTARSSRSASRPAGCSPGPRMIKTADEAALYGGVAGVAYDPCYHQACDNLTGTAQDAALYDALRERLHGSSGNINRHALDVNSDAFAAAVIDLRVRHLDRERRAGAPGSGPGQERWVRADPRHDQGPAHPLTTTDVRAGRSCDPPLP